METVDVRLLVRGRRRAPGELLEQLLRGVLRVHAAVELVPDPRVATRDGRANPTYGHHVPVAPVHRHRDAVRFDVAQTWDGRDLRDDPARRELAARFATQDATREAAANEVAEVVEAVTTYEALLDHVRTLCRAALAVPGPVADLAEDVLRLLDEDPS